MKDVDFKTCEFIKERMRFLTYFDFCNNRKIIKCMYKEFDNNAKMFYKWYLYSNIHMTEQFKNAIWDYLNFNDIYYELELIALKQKYRVK